MREDPLFVGIGAVEKILVDTLAELRREGNEWEWHADCLMTVVQGDGTTARSLRRRRS